MILVHPGAQFLPSIFVDTKITWLLPRLIQVQFCCIVLRSFGPRKWNVTSMQSETNGVCLWLDSFLFVSRPWEMSPVEASTMQVLSVFDAVIVNKPLHVCNWLIMWIDRRAEFSCVGVCSLLLSSVEKMFVASTGVSWEFGGCRKAIHFDLWINVIAKVYHRTSVSIFDLMWLQKCITEHPCQSLKCCDRKFVIWLSPNNRFNLWIDEIAKVYHRTSMSILELMWLQKCITEHPCQSLNWCGCKSVSPNIHVNPWTDVIAMLGHPPSPLQVSTEDGRDGPKDPNMGIQKQHAQHHPEVGNDCFCVWAL